MEEQSFKEQTTDQLYNNLNNSSDKHTIYSSFSF